MVVHFFNYYEGYIGTFYPKDQYMSGKLLIKQVQKFEKDRLKIAKSNCERNRNQYIYEVLYHYYKHEKKGVKLTIDWIKKEFYQNVENAEILRCCYLQKGNYGQNFIVVLSIFFRKIL